MKVSSQPSQMITHSLGSCIGVAIYDPLQKVGGLLHFQLPWSTDDPQKSEANPYMFADTGIEWLIEAAIRRGACKFRLVAKLCGGASVMDPSGLFRIGQRNYSAARRVLENMGIPVLAEDVGGNRWRTVLLDLWDGVLTVKTQDAQYRI